MASRPERKPAGRRRPRAKAAAIPATGPVSLAEAEALAAARRPKRAAARAASKAAAATEPTSPEAVGKEREKLAQRRREEVARRVRAYKDTMEIMKARGARAPRAKRGAARGGRAAEAAGFAPLQVFAEGDSWFDYPVPFFGGGIIPRLQDRLGVPILNLAEAGDEVRYMLGVKQRERLAEHLAGGCPAGGPWDALLFSGGGNDIVDNPMALWVRDFDPSLPPEDHVHQPRFGAALSLVRAGYEDLIAMRDRLSPATHLVFHGYDFGIPDGRGICHLGPWLKPTFDLRGFPTRAAASAVSRAMLLQFADLLTSLAASPNVTFINAQGTLSPRTGSWHNELHPSSRGFDKFAAVFQDKLRVLFPGRVA